MSTSMLLIRFFARTVACCRSVGRLPLAAFVWGALLLQPVQAQDKVRLRLQDQSDHGREVLPEGTEVLVLRKEGSRAQTLEQLGIDRDDLRSRLLDRAKKEPTALLDMLDANGKTQRRYPQGKLHYALARTPEGMLYETQVGGEPGFDLVVSGNQIIAPVPDGKLEGVFEEAVTASTKSRLTLIRKGRLPLSENTEVCVWVRDGATPQAVQDRSFLKGNPVYEGQLAKGGMTEKQLGRTWHTGRVLYVAAQTPSGVLYESQISGRPGFSRVGEGKINMGIVPPSGQEVIRSVFSTSSFFDRGYGKIEGWGEWLGLPFIGFMFGLASAWWYKKRSVK